MGDNLSDLSNSAIQEINECSSSNDLESIRVKYLGKKGTVTAALKSLSEINLLSFSNFSTFELKSKILLS